MKQKDKYDEHACEFKNEAECEEELEEDGNDFWNIEKKHFEEEEIEDEE